METKASSWMEFLKSFPAEETLSRCWCRKRAGGRKPGGGGGGGGGGSGPVFCSPLPFSTLRHHWWHVQPLKLLANRLSSFALSPRIIGVKGHRASQLMSRRAPRSPQKLPQWSARRAESLSVETAAMRRGVLVPAASLRT